MSNYDDAVDTPDQVIDVGAFWTTAAQLAGVFAIPLVLEARRFAVRWPRTSIADRRRQSAFIFGAGCSIVWLVLISLSSLISPSRNYGEMFVAAILLGAVAFGLVVQPVLSLFLVVNRDLYVALARAMPWSNFRVERRAFRTERSDFVRISGVALEQYETVSSQVEVLIALGERGRQQDQEIAVLHKAARDLLAQAKQSGDTNLIRETAKIVRGILAEKPHPKGTFSEPLAEARNALVRMDANVLKLAIPILNALEKSESQHENFSYFSPSIRAEFEKGIIGEAEKALDPTTDVAGFRSVVAETAKDLEKIDREVKEVGAATASTLRV